ncbi:unnamed protein product [Dicrocoelium dendriticum]|nr:unnamed protein product [Dicrocoelium dendriticum]
MTPDLNLTVIHWDQSSRFDIELPALAEPAVKKICKRLWLSRLRLSSGKASRWSVQENQNLPDCMQSVVGGYGNPVVITVQPEAVETQEDTDKDWHSQLLDIPDYTTFALSCLCPFIMSGSVGQEVGRSFTLCCLASFCSLITLQIPCHWVVGCMLRRSVRKRYHIRGNECYDWCTYCCCYACVLNQAALQAEYEKAKLKPQDNATASSVRLNHREYRMTSPPVTDPLKITVPVYTAQSIPPVPQPPLAISPPAFPSLSSPPSLSPTESLDVHWSTVPRKSPQTSRNIDVPYSASMIEPMTQTSHSLQSNTMTDRDMVEPCRWIIGSSVSDGT